MRLLSFCLLACLSVSSVCIAAKVSDQLLIEVVSSGSEELLSRLLAQDVAIDAKGAHGETALHLAAREGNPRIMGLLLEKGATADARDMLARTPLMLAAEGGHVRSAEMLVERGADPNAADKTGTTVLMWACASGNRDLARLLLRKGAKLNAEDREGRTAYDWVRFDMDRIVLADFFRDLGAKSGSHTRSKGNLIELARRTVARDLSASEKAAGYTYGENLKVFSEKKAAGYYLLGSVLLLEGSTEKAAASLAEAEKLDAQGCKPCRLPLAVVYAQIGRGSEAVAMFQKLAISKPKDARLTRQIFDVAETIFEGGNAYQAGQLFEMVLTRSEDFPAAHYYLGRSADENNLLDLAREHLAAFLEMAPDGPFAGDARERMAQLSPTHVNVTGFDDKRLDTADLEGKHVLVDIWLVRDSGDASLELLNKIAGDVNGLEIISVNAAGNFDEARRTAADLGISWRQFWDPGMRYFGQTYGLQQIPSMILLGPEGRVALRVSGEETGKRSLIRKVKKAMR